jgi:hypothetical protein
MGAADRAVWFLGDLEDPWVASLTGALPERAHIRSCGADLPADLAELAAAAEPPPRVVVVHRALLTATDADRLARLRGALMPSPRVVLCIGPHVRHADLELWSARGVIDVAIPEATARDVLARHLVAAEADPLARRPVPRKRRPTVGVISGNVELRRTLADACQVLGYPAEPFSDVPALEHAGPILWDVPMLEPDWPHLLARLARLGPVVVLLGFADRAVVAQARAEGAAACLELPFDLVDLAHVLDRITGRRADARHAVPPAPASARRRRRDRVAGAGPDS